MEYLKKIFSSILLLLFLLLFIYTFNRSEFYWDGIMRDYYLIYYILSSLLFFLSFVSFFISSKNKEYLIILGMCSVVSLYAFEGYLTYKNSYYQNIKKKKKIYEKTTGNKFDTRPRLKVFEDLKKIEKNVSVKVSPQNWLKNNLKIFPFSSVSNSTTVYGIENGYYFIYKSDRFGFNNPDDEWDSEEIEYLLTGDSFVHGANVNRPNDLSSVLRTLSNKSVLNLGYSGTGSLIHYASLREYLSPNVKKVLWFYFEDNDLVDLDNEIKNNILINYLNNPTFSQNLKLRQDEINILVGNLISKGEHERFKFLKLYETRSKFLKKKQKWKEIIQTSPEHEFKIIIKLARDLVIQNNSELYFIYLPGYERYKTKNNNIHYNSVKKIVDELDIPFIDIHKGVFLKQKNPLKLFPFEMNGHYNVKGYQMTAKYIYDTIEALDK